MLSIEVHTLILSCLKEIKDLLHKIQKQSDVTVCWREKRKKRKRLLFCRFVLLFMWVVE